MAWIDGMPSLTEAYDRETKRRQRNPVDRPTGNPGLIKTNPVTGIRAQLERASGRRSGIDDVEAYLERPEQARDHAKDERVAAYKAERDSTFQGRGGRGTCGQCGATPGHAHADDCRHGGFPTPVAPVRTEPLAQDNQKGLFRRLLAELRTHNPEVWAKARDWFEGTDTMPGVVHTITKREISPAITRLREHLAAPAGQPMPTPVSDDAPVRRPGAAAWKEWRDLAARLVEFGGHTGARFAVDTEPGAANTVAFWWIVPDQDTGRYFLRQVIGGQGPTRVRMSPEAMIAIARKIWEAGPKEAMLRYGREMGSCGHCGRSLTNDESRTYGIGPVCRNKKGW